MQPSFVNYVNDSTVVGVDGDDLLDHSLTPKEWLLWWLGTFWRLWRKGWKMEICLPFGWEPTAAVEAAKSQWKGLHLWTAACLLAWWHGCRKSTRSHSRKSGTGATVLTPSYMLQSSYRDTERPHNHTNLLSLLTHCGRGEGEMVTEITLRSMRTNNILDLVFLTWSE